MANPIYHPPKPPSDRGPFAAWIDYLVKWATSERVLDIKGFNVQQTLNGKIFIPPYYVAPGKTKSNTGFNVRGTWTASPTTPYMTLDVVILGTGTAAGMYYSTIDGNVNSPDSGIGWVQISSSQGTWL